jgi:hypothetical protein
LPSYSNTLALNNNQLKKMSDVLLDVHTSTIQKFALMVSEADDQAE